MAGCDGRTDSSLIPDLFSRGFEFDFFQAVRLLTNLTFDGKAVGGSARPEDEAVRFHAWTSMAFPASAVDWIEHRPGDAAQAHMIVTFLGLTGIEGVLPVYYSDALIAAAEEKNEGLPAFFDIFNHRLISLFYRAWLKHRPVALHESAARGNTYPDLFTHSVFDLIGMGTAALRGRTSIPDYCLLRYAGLIAQRPCSATALRGVLSDYFAVPVEIEQCVGSWYDLEDSDRCYLSAGEERNQLGIGAFLGDRVWDQQARFRVRLGAVDWDTFRAFLPDGERAQELKDLLRFLTGQALVVDVQLVLHSAQVPDMCVSEQGERAPRLGWSSWLIAGESLPQDPGDAVFTYLT